MAKTQSLVDLCREMQYLIDKVENEQVQGDLNSKMGDIIEQINNIEVAKKYTEDAYDILRDLTY